jgi:hypothetical protein
MKKRISKIKKRNIGRDAEKQQNKKWRREAAE